MNCYGSLGYDFGMASPHIPALQVVKTDKRSMGNSPSPPRKIRLDAQNLRPSQSKSVGVRKSASIEVPAQQYKVAQRLVRAQWLKLNPRAKALVGRVKSLVRRCQGWIDIDHRITLGHFCGFQMKSNADHYVVDT